MHNFTNNNLPSNAPEDGKKIRAALKSSESWVHKASIDEIDKKEKLIKDIETEHERVMAFFKRIKEISEEIKTLTDAGEVTIREKLLNVLDYQKFLSVRKRNELAKGLSVEEKLELENKLTTDLSLEVN